MSFDELFENRSLVASKLKECLRDKGYTKISFAKKANISRPTLDKILNGSLASKAAFDRHMQKIIKTLNTSVDDLVLFSARHEQPITAIYSQNTPADHKKSSTASKQFDLLMDIVDLCAIYY